MATDVGRKLLQFKMIEQRAPIQPNFYRNQFHQKDKDRS